MPDMVIPPVMWTVNEIVVWGGDKGENRIVVKIPLETQPQTMVASLRVASVWSRSR